MADQDFLSYSSIYDTFSKGPKSIYHGIGDEMLPGAILNVPQTDEDDEWGRTQRIEGERTYDFIAKIYKTLFDPYNVIGDVSFVPGEAGSEINVAKNMIRLVGRSGIDTGVFDLTVPSLTLGSAVIDGSAGTISIGENTTLTATGLTINSNVLFESATDSSTYQFKDKNILRFTNDGTNPVYTEIVVNGKSYRFDETGMTLPVGTSISGTINSNNIIPTSNNTFTVGSDLLRYANIYGVLGNFSGNVTAAAFYSGSFGGQDTAVTVCGTSISLKQAGGPTIALANDDFSATVNNIVALGSSSTRFRNLYSVSGNFSGSLTTAGILPSTTNTYDIGSDTFKYSNIYAANGYFTSSVNTPSLCSSGAIRTYGTSFEVMAGEDTISRFTATGLRMYQDIRPISDNSQNLGAPSTKFAYIYSVTAQSDYFSGYNFGSSGGNVTICGSSVTLLDTVSYKSLYFENTEFRPSSTNHVNLGTASLQWKSIYVKDAYVSSSLTAGYVLTQNIGDSGAGSNVTICSGNSVTLQALTSGLSVRIDGNGFGPLTSNNVALGAASTPFKELWLYDGFLGEPKKVRVCNGVILITS